MANLDFSKMDVNEIKSYVSKLGTSRQSIVDINSRFCDTLNKLTDTNVIQGSVVAEINSRREASLAAQRMLLQTLNSYETWLNQNVASSQDLDQRHATQMAQIEKVDYSQYQ